MSNEDLAKAAAAGDHAAAQQLWQKNLPIITKWNAALLRSDARKHIADAAGITFDDLMQCSYFAILKAVNSYAASGKCSYLSALKFAILTEFFSACGIRSSKRDPLNSCASLSDPIAGNDEMQLSDTIEDPQAEQQLQAVDDQIYNDQLHAALERSMQALPDQRQAEAVKRRYFDRQTAKEIAEGLHISQQRTNAIIKAALRQMSGSDDLKEYRDSVIHQKAYSFGSGFTEWLHNGSVEERTIEYLEKHHILY